jgi:hypothetical protein
LNGIDKSVYSISGLSVVAQPSDKKTWIGNFDFSVTAVLKNYNTLQANSEEVTVTISDPCTSTTIDASQTINDMSTTIYGDPVTRTFVEFTDSADQASSSFGTGKCGAREYSLTLADGNPVPDFLSLTSASK